MKKAIYIALFLISLASFAQSEQEFIDREIENIEFQFSQKGISDYFILQLYTPGASYISLTDHTKCDPHPDTTKFVFWKEGGKNWVKRVSKCGVSSDVQVIDFKPLDFVIENITSIEKDNVLRYSHKAAIQLDGKTYTNHIENVHSPVRILKFHFQNRSFQKRIDTFNLTNSEDELNLNFDYNNALPIVQLSNECHRIVEKLEEQRMFETILKID